MMSKVSVVITCYNLGQYIDEAVESVLAQTYQDFEIIIVDDGSTDEATLTVLGSYDRPKTRIIRTKNQGVSLARNVGIGVACGEYILPLDADDRIAGTYMEKAVKILDASPGIGIVSSWMEVFEDEPGSYVLPNYCRPRLKLDGILGLAERLYNSSFFRKSDWSSTRGYDPKLFRGMEDSDFWIAILQLGREAYIIPETLYFYRQRFGGLHHLSRNEYVSQYAKMIRNHPHLYIENVEAVFSHILDLTELCYRVGLLQTDLSHPVG
jgi:glycosyltransferase involved in cell wall biosynthesis